MLRKRACGLAAVSLLMFGTASAATITFEFSGTVTYGAPMAVALGTRITGTYSYDTETAPEIQLKGFASYSIPAPHTMTLTVDGHTISTSILNVAVWNHYKGNVEDMFQVSSGPVTLDGTFFPDGSLSFGLASAPRNNRPCTARSCRLRSA
jgi:hypothetical protein